MCDCYMTTFSSLQHNNTFITLYVHYTPPFPHYNTFTTALSSITTPSQCNTLNPLQHSTTVKHLLHTSQQYLLYYTTTPSVSHYNTFTTQTLTITPLSRIFTIHNFHYSKISSAPIHHITTFTTLYQHTATPQYNTNITAPSTHYNNFTPLLHHSSTISSHIVLSPPITPQHFCQLLSKVLSTTTPPSPYYNTSSNKNNKNVALTTKFQKLKKK